MSSARCHEPCRTTNTFLINSIALQVLRVDLQTMEVANMSSIDGAAHLLTDSAVYLNGKIYVLGQDENPMWLHDEADRVHQLGDDFNDIGAQLERTKYKWLM